MGNLLPLVAERRKLPGWDSAASLRPRLDDVGHRWRRQTCCRRACALPLEAHGELAAACSGAAQAARLGFGRFVAPAFGRRSAPMITSNVLPESLRSSARNTWGTCRRFWRSGARRPAAVRPRLDDVGHRRRRQTCCRRACALPVETHGGLAAAFGGAAQAARLRFGRFVAAAFGRRSAPLATSNVLPESLRSSAKRGGSFRATDCTVHALWS